MLNALMLLQPRVTRVKLIEEPLRVLRISGNGRVPILSIRNPLQSRLAGLLFLDDPKDNRLNGAMVKTGDREYFGEGRGCRGLATSCWNWDVKRDISLMPPLAGPQTLFLQNIQVIECRLDFLQVKHGSMEICHIELGMSEDVPYLFVPVDHGLRHAVVVMA